MERKRIVCQGSIPEFEHDGDEMDRYYLPGRGLVLSGSRHLLPDHQMMIDYAHQFNNILSQLGLMPRNVGFIPDSHYLLDEAILENLQIMKRDLSSPGDYLVYPYAVTENLLRWCGELKNLGLSIESMFPKKIYFEDLDHPSHRGGWGRWVDEPERLSFPEEANLPYPTSWIGRNLEEIVEAYYRVCQETKTPSAVIKPIFSAGGFTLKIVNNEEDLRKYYQKLNYERALDLFNEKIPIEVQSFVPDITAFYSLQYLKGILITPGKVCQQIIKETSWQGNLFNLHTWNHNSYQIEMVLEQASEIWQNFSQFYPDIENEWGGLDLALTSEGRLIILEHNGQRITGAIPAIAAASQLGVKDSPFATLKSPANPACDLKALWDFLCTENFAYDSSKKEGVFPIVWLPGSGMLLAVSDNPIKLLERVYSQLQKLGYLKTDEKRPNN